MHNYTPDFLLPNGIYLECKGYWEAEDRRKIKAVKQQHPEIDLRMVFQAPFNKISKKSKLHTHNGAKSTTYLGLALETSQSLGSSEFVRHEACLECGSSDGNSVYSDGHTFCFVCHTHKHGDNTYRSQSSTRMSYLGSAERLQKRNISQKTCERYKIFKDGDVLRMYYHNASGSPIGAKVRTKNKVFTYEGESDGSFFGQHLFFRNSKEKSVVITEGELDAASVSEALGDFPAVSLPSGAAAAKKAMKNNYEWLQQFEKIILWFDNDEPGLKAAKDAANALPPGKVFIATLDAYKDASDALQANDYKAIEQAYWSAKAYRPDGIVDGKSLLELVTTPTHLTIMIIPFKDYSQNYTVFDTENLQQLLQGVVSESQASAGNLQLLYSKLENGSVIWLLKNPIDVQHSD